MKNSVLALFLKYSFSASKSFEYQLRFQQVNTMSSLSCFFLLKHSVIFLNVSGSITQAF